MGKQGLIAVLLISSVAAVVLISGCVVYPTDDLGVTKQITGTHLYCRLNSVSPASLNGVPYYVVNVTLTNNGTSAWTFVAQDFTLSDVPTANQNVDFSLGANSTGDYDFYFNRIAINIGHAYVFGFHKPGDILRRADFNLTLT